MSFGFQQTGQQHSDFERVKQIMNSLRPPTAGNPRILAIDQAPLIKAKNGGYPLFMYHPTLDPQYVTREDQQLELEKLGYGTVYIPRQYPKMLMRRNMDPRFDSPQDKESDPKEGYTPAKDHTPFVEFRVVADAQQEQRVLSERKPQKLDRETKQPYFVGEWKTKLDDVDPLPQGPEEDPAITIARLEGQLQGSARQESAPKRRGRKPKTEPAEAVA